MCGASLTVPLSKLQQETSTRNMYVPTNTTTSCGTVFQRYLQTFHKVQVVVFIKFLHSYFYRSPEGGNEKSKPIQLFFQY